MADVLKKIIAHFKRDVGRAPTKTEIKDKTTFDLVREGNFVVDDQEIKVSAHVYRPDETAELMDVL